MNFKDMATVGSGEIRKLGRLDGNKEMEVTLILFRSTVGKLWKEIKLSILA